MTSPLLGLLTLLLLQPLDLFAWQDYKDYKVYELKPQRVEDLKLIRKWSRKTHFGILSDQIGMKLQSR